MQKPQLQVITYYDFSSARAYIDEKYGIDQDDYDRKFKDLKVEPGSSETFEINEDREFKCFWHFLCNYYQLSNGSPFTINNDMKGGAERWQQEIIDMYINEFGEEAEYRAEW